MLLNKFDKNGFINEPFEMKCLFCYGDNNYSYVSSEEFTKIKYYVILD